MSGEKQSTRTGRRHSPRLHPIQEEQPQPLPSTAADAKLGERSQAPSLSTRREETSQAARRPMTTHPEGLAFVLMIGLAATALLMLPRLPLLFGLLYDASPIKALVGKSYFPVYWWEMKPPMVSSHASLLWILSHMCLGFLLLLHRTVLVFKTLCLYAQKDAGDAQAPPPRAASVWEYRLFTAFLVLVLLNLDNTARVYPAAFTLAILVALSLLAISFDAFALVRHRIPQAAQASMKYSLETKEHVIFFTISYLAVLLEVLRLWTLLSINVDAY
jgi:hypothetical protein